MSTPQRAGEALARGVGPLVCVAAELTVVGLAATVFSTTALAQDSLVRVDELSRSGRTEEARVVLLDWWDAEVGAATRAERQHAIWLRAVLTVDPAEAALDYQRLAVEYPGGRFTDRALTRLAQIAELMGQPDRAADYYRRVLRDHPGSPYGEEASRWLQRNRPSPRTPIESTPERPRRRDRARSAQPVRARPRPVSPGPARPPRQLPQAVGDFTVQVGAFSGEELAADLVAQLVRRGFEARRTVITGSDLVRVRVGRFQDAEAATRLYDRLRASGFDAMVLADASRERPIG